MWNPLLCSMKVLDELSAALAKQKSWVGFERDQSASISMEVTIRENDSL